MTITPRPTPVISADPVELPITEDRRKVLHCRLQFTVTLATLAALFTAFLLISVSLTVTGSSASSTQSLKWPITQHGDPLSSNGNGVTIPLKYGTVLTAAQSVHLRSPSNAMVASYSGKSGFALGDINQLQYPLITSDGGRSWAIAGPYFAGPWADASAGGTIIHALSSSIAMVYGNEWFYSTTDRGRHWYVTSFPGTAIGADEYWNRVPRTPIFTVDVTLSSPNPPYQGIATAQYLSLDGGRNWRLVAKPSGWSKNAVSTLKIQGGYANPAKIGARLTASNIKAWPITSPTFSGNVGYALSGVNGFQYPVRSTDHGGTWRIAGIWFAGPWADGASFALDIKTLSAQVAVAKAEGFFYVTDDEGRHWHQTSVAGNPNNCSLLRPRWVLAAVLTCSFASLSTSGAATYLSDDGGRTWLLLAGKEGQATGDPGGRVMTQLVPAISAVPARASINYVWKLEPHQDSCDGIAATRGWSQVVVQIGFTWQRSASALFTAMNGRLIKLGWRHIHSAVAVPLEYLWSKKLTNNTEAKLSVDQESPKSYWQFDAVAPPVGKAAGGPPCVG